MKSSLGWKLGLLTTLVALTAVPAWAQRVIQQGQPQQPQARPAQLQRPNTAQQPAAQQRTALRPVQGQVDPTDHQIAGWLLLCNETEVHAAQMAEKKAHDKQIRQFAGMLDQQHRQLIDKLRQFAPDISVNAPNQQAQGNAAQSDRQGNVPQQPQQTQQAANPQTPAQQNAAPQRDRRQGLPVLEISRQLAQRAQAMMDQELSRKDGSDFDRAFIEEQVFEHLAMLNTLEVLKPYASSALQTAIDEGIQGTQQHLAQARQLCAQLHGETSADRSQQSLTGNRENGRDDANAKSDDAKSKEKRD